MKFRRTTSPRKVLQSKNTEALRLATVMKTERGVSAVERRVLVKKDIQSSGRESAGISSGYYEW